MSDPIDLTEEREKREGPDHDHFVFVDGVKWFEFTCSYDDDEGSNFRFSIWARDFADAESRIAALRSNARLNGQLYSTVPA